jgi:hypothetical protein
MNEQENRYKGAEIVACTYGKETEKQREAHGKENKH